MAAIVICPECKEENSGSSLHCVKCQASLIGIPRQTLDEPPSNEEIVNREQTVIKHTIAQAEELIRAENRFKAGVSDFFWIAGLSIVNSVVLLVGGEWFFFIGLGITLVIDSLASVIAQDVGGTAGIVIKVVAFILDLIVAGLFVGIGLLARRKHKWAYITGMLLYALDGLIYLVALDLISLGFHVLILFGLLAGYRAMKKHADILEQTGA